MVRRHLQEHLPKETPPGKGQVRVSVPSHARLRAIEELITKDLKEF